MADTESSGKIELAKAYVQIVPSFDGLSKELKKAFGDAEKEVGGDKGGELGDEFGEKWSETTTKAVKAGAAAIGALIGSSLLEGGKLEQSLGGVETLFKDSADTVVENAEKAFETAGLSANDYMEQATSFAASLIDSLDGDTEAAAASANLAMVDMADNANKYGSSVESIQNAYQGFMRKSYVMLDNLKLGYGGTKTEMERLLADAQELSGVEYNIDNLSDVFTAIHVIQEDLGIAGTTAEEAATTLQGSFSAMKAAAQNLLGYMSTGEGDVIEAFDDLTETAKTFAGNAFDMIGNAFDGIYEIISEKTGLSADAIEGMAEAFAAFVAVVEAGKIVKKIKAAIDEVGSLSTAISKIITPETAIIAAGAAAIATIINTIQTVKKNVAEAEEYASNYENFVSEEQAELIETTNELTQAYDDLKSEISDSQADYQSQAASADTMIDRLYELQNQTKLTTDEQTEMETLIASLNDEYDGLNLELDDTTGLLNLTESETRDLIDAQLEQAKVTAVADQLTELYKQQYEAEKNLKEVTENKAKQQEKVNSLQEEFNQSTKRATELQKILNSAGGYTEENVKEYSELVARIKELYGNGGNGGLIDEAQLVLEGMNSTYGEAQTAVDDVNDSIESLINYMSGDEYSTATEGIEDANESLTNSLVTVTDEGIEYAEGSFEELLTTIEEARDEYQEQLASTAEDVWSSFDLFDDNYGVTYVTETWVDENGVEQTETYLETTAETLQQALDNNLQNIQEWTEEIQGLYERGISDTLYQTLADMGVSSRDQVHALTTMTDTELQEYSDKFGKAYGAAENVANAKLKLVCEESADTIAELISDATGNTKNVEQAYALLADASAQGYIYRTRDLAVDFYEASRETLDRATGSELADFLYTKMEDIGKYAVAGFKQGIFDGTDDIETTSFSIAQLTIDSLNEKFQINSPSKVMKEIGGYVSEGLAIGIADGTDGVIEASNEVGMSAVEGIQAELDGVQNSITAQTAISTATHLDGSVTVNGELTLLQQAVALLTAIRNKSTTLAIDGKTVGATLSPYVDSAMGQAYVYSQRGVAT